MTSLEKISRLGTLGGHKYLSPELKDERERMINELEADGLTGYVDRMAINNMIAGFSLIDPLHEEIYAVAYKKQLRSHH